MAAWRPWLWWLWLWLWWSLAALAVVPEGEGGGVGRGQRDGGWVKSGPECPSGCSCSHPNQVYCKASSRDKYPPHPSADTTTLLLEDYKVVLSHFLARLKNLQYLKVTRSELQDLTTIPPLPQLKILDLQDNQVESLAGGHIRASWPALTHLLLAHNSINKLTDNDLAGCDHLQNLDLSHNPLLSVSEGSLRGLNDLTRLNLSQTKLPQLPYRWLTDTPHLHYLNVSGSALHQLPRLAGKNLKVFDASHNAITKLPDRLVAGASNLEKLLLHHNPLTHVQVSVLTGGSSLLYLDLHHTRLVNMDEFVFQGVPRLEQLRLDHNSHLQRVEHGAFAGLHHLKHLSLTHTPNLVEIEEVAFAGLPNLRTLDLRDSGLSVLPRSLARLVKYNTSVFLAGTALRCDCYHYWLPNLLITSNISSWDGVDPIKCRDGESRSVRRLAADTEALGCVAPEPATPSDGWVMGTRTQGALLDCNVTANPPHKVLWFSAKHQVFRYNYSDGRVKDEWQTHQIQQAEGAAKYHPRFEVLESGQLLIQDVLREDVGWYKCFAYNSAGNTSVMAFLTLSDAPFRALYVESLLFGFACAALFLFITLLVQLVNYLMDRLGCECCCCKGRLSPKARQIRRLLESVEAYKTQQLDRLRENYNCQVVSIKESCYQQMERIRESYSSQGKNLRDLRDYSTQGLTTIRDQYVDQVNRVRDYSVSQMNRVRENYVFQRHRIRKFSAHQLLRLRETYKYQQKTLNKILENLPDLYLQNCRTGGCQRTDSLVFDDTLHGIDAYYKVDFLDTQSHHSSDYYTPASTLTRSFRSSRGQEPIRQPSCTSSNASSDFVEAQLWLRRESSTAGGSSPSRTFPSHGRGQHSRSLSVGGPAAFVTDPVRVHKRSLSACHPSHRVAPAPESRGVPARITLREEVGDGGTLTPPSAPSSVPTTPTHISRRRLLLDGGAGTLPSTSSRGGVGGTPSPTNSLQNGGVLSPNSSGRGSAAGVHSPTSNKCATPTKRQESLNKESDKPQGSESVSEDPKATSESESYGVNLIEGSDSESCGVHPKAGGDSASVQESPQSNDESSSNSSAFETSL